MGRRLFKVLGTAGASSFPIETSDEWGDYVEFSDDLYHPDRFAIRVRGESMEGRIPHNAYVLVHPDPKPPAGLLTVARNESHEYVIKILKQRRGDWVLIPINPDYDEIKPGEGWKIVGYVVGIREERGRRKYREEGDNDGLRP
ncbi:hypothetical protein OP10G_3603 [Fimbriimonas ginsengisoli Gsoil 348]|uniref:Peptidase S24/S26A/S26B/S26C domain-containing protein n=1 Tax=Fimbriimonas ginsengisoli Gsoil 348 TaxID=661478 RepID=A0A068NU51_FIMGI|nr:hypothetical protein OP10G_3603 [Fimbriimonas ginsengisoli Gsoil 348]